MPRLIRDVIVVGGGPVGVTTALLLAHRGFAVTVYERATEVYDLPRAIVMDDEIQRVFQGIGLLDELHAITTPLAGAEFVAVDGTRIIGAAMPSPEATPLGLAPGIAYYQPQLEAFLRTAAADAGVRFHLGCTVDSVHDLGDHVVISATTPDGGVTDEAGWLIAADGAASPIRKALGVSFVDQGFDQDWLVIDVELTGTVDLPPFVQQICDPDRPTTFVPGHADYRRWEFQLQPGETRDEINSPARVWELLAPWLTPDEARLIRSVVYRFHATVASRMRVGRVFLAGDSAHQMPPFLGQGLCSGIRDAANLAWKLDLVVADLAADSLLDTYDLERLPHAAGVVAHAVDTGRLIDQLAGREARSVGLDAAYGGQRPFPRLERGVLAGDHPFVGRQLPQPLLDGRRLDTYLGTGFAIAVATADALSPATADRWRALDAAFVVVPEGTLGDLVGGTGGVIVRPDRYVAAVCADSAELDAASEHFFAIMNGAAV